MQKIVGHPLVITLYENSTLEKYLQQLKAIEKNNKMKGLTLEEKVMMRILEKETLFSTPASTAQRTKQTRAHPAARK